MQKIPVFALQCIFQKVNYSLPLNSEQILTLRCFQLYKLLTKDGWYAVSHKVSHVKMRREIKKGRIIFPNHGSHEIGVSKYMMTLFLSFVLSDCNLKLTTFSTVQT